MINRDSLKLKTKRTECDALCAMLFKTDLDGVVRDCSSFESFDDLLNAEGNYRPSLDVSEFKRSILADCYDKLMELRGDDRRAYRYGTYRKLGDIYKVSNGAKKWKLVTPVGLVSKRTKTECISMKNDALAADPKFFDPNNPHFRKDIRIHGRNYI